MHDIMPKVIFAEAMWRSGSTYLASRFAASDRYMLFYEPCHEGVGRRPSKARTRDRQRDRNLRHPQLDGGYFGMYERADPASGLPLSRLFAPETSMRNVYGEASAATVAYLAALARTARAEGKTAFLGFCRSGTQLGPARAALGGASLHLWRAPREQFASYGWPENDYFITGTLLQLSFSKPYSRLAQQLAPCAFASSAVTLAKLLPDRRTRLRYRIASWTAAGLTPTDAYALFYLSWLICYQYGLAHSDVSFSLTQLTTDQELRQLVEERFGISFQNLRPTPSACLSGIDYDAIESRVSALLAGVGAKAADRLA